MSTGVPGFLFLAERRLSMIPSIHDSSDEALLFWRIIMNVCSGMNELLIVAIKRGSEREGSYGGAEEGWAIDGEEKKK
jgi:hypothetical protein